MALVDIDRHILTELVVLQEKMKNSAIEFRDLWEEIQNVRDLGFFIALEERGLTDTKLPKLKQKVERAMKACNTKMIYMDDCMSRSAALLNHLVSEIKQADTGRGTETYE